MSVAHGVHGDAAALVIATSAEVGGVDQPGARRIQLRHEGVVGAAAVTRLKRPWDRGEVGRSGMARDIGIAQAVQGDAKSEVIVTAPEKGGIDKPSPKGIQFCYERVYALRPPPAEGGLESSRRRRKIRRIGVPHNIGVATGVHRDPNGACVTKRTPATER